MNKILFTTLIVSCSLAAARADQSPTAVAPAPAQLTQTEAAPAPIAAKTSLPSRESVKRLVDALGLKQAYDQFYNRIESMVGMQLMRSTTGIKSTDEIKATVKAAHDKLMMKIQADLGWGKIEESYVDEYAKNFTQDEIDGLVTFYESPLGKAYVAKQGAINQQANRKIGITIGPVMKEIRTEIEKATAEIRSKGKLVGGATPPMPGAYPPMLMKPPVAPSASAPPAASKPAPQ